MDILSKHFDVGLGPLVAIAALCIFVGGVLGSLAKGEPLDEAVYKAEGSEAVISGLEKLTSFFIAADAMVAGHFDVVREVEPLVWLRAVVVEIDSTLEGLEARKIAEKVEAHWRLGKWQGKVEDLDHELYPGAQAIADKVAAKLTKESDANV